MPTKPKLAFRLSDTSILTFIFLRDLAEDRKLTVQTLSGDIEFSMSLSGKSRNMVAIKITVKKQRKARHG